MTIRLNLRTGAILIAALAVLVAGIAYAATQIQRGLPGSYIIGQVQTADATILLYKKCPPSTGDLKELNFGIVDIDAFGTFVNPTAIK